jgi:hypothetical protein
LAMLVIRYENGELLERVMPGQAMRFQTVRDNVEEADTCGRF